jgi:hypothetical protein
MEKYIVQLFGFNEDSEKKELLGSAFLVRPNFLITAAHVVSNEIGCRYKNKGFPYGHDFYILPNPLYLDYKIDYSKEDSIYADLAIYGLDFEIPTAFLLTERIINYKDRYNFYSVSDLDEFGNNSRLKSEVTISFSTNVPKIYEPGRAIMLKNCIAIKELLNPGDSGAPIFFDEEVVGMVVYSIIGTSNNPSEGSSYGTVAIRSSFIKGILETIK